MARVGRVALAAALAAERRRRPPPLPGRRVVQRAPLGRGGSLPSRCRRPALLERFHERGVRRARHGLARRGYGDVGAGQMSAPNRVAGGLYHPAPLRPGLSGGVPSPSKLLARAAT